MCGIFGWVTDKSKGAPDFNVGKALTDLLVHRGPDDQGYVAVQNCFLGHRRLAIIDISSAGHQPFVCPDKRYYLVFNGEIYNYLELKKELEALGVRFLTKSDTEVLLNAYIVWGTDCLKKLEGMFAFAIYDTKTRDLFLCRDHIGQKPLYYTYTNGQFIFSSELRCIIKHPNIDPKIDLNSLLKYHLYDFLPYNQSILKDVHKLQAGHYLLFRGEKILINSYWESFPGQESELSLDDALEKLDELMLLSVTKHLRSDVPYGVFLSGGVDSSLIVSYARKALGTEPLKTLSIAVDFENFDESPVAKDVADKYRTDHKVLHLTEERLKRSVEVMLNHLDEPLADPGLINAHFISSQAVQDFKVALSGDGGDELFGGYITFRAAQLEPVFRYLPARLIELLKFFTRQFLPTNSSYMSFDFKLNSFLKGFPGPDILRNQCWLAGISPENLRELYKDADVPQGFFERTVHGETIFSELVNVSAPVKDSTLINKMLFQYSKFLLPEFVCAHTDRASMKVSLEVRSPLIHKPLIEFANSLPSGMKVKNGRLKRILFDLVKMQQLPQKVSNHPKQGFVFPVAGWLRTHLRETMEDILSEKNISEFGIIDVHKITEMKRQHVAGHYNHYKSLWNLMIFFKWLRNYPEVRL